MNQPNKITFVSIILIATLTQIAMDIYTPSLPAIAHHFMVTLGQSQGTMSAFILGVALTTLIYGPLSEVTGRKATIIIGISIAIVGTALCMFSMNIHMLYIGRLIQGCGLGACSAIWRSIFRDAYSGDALTRIGGYFVIAMTLSAILAPFAGGFIQQHLGWRYNFIILFIWIVAVFLKVCFMFKETSQHHGAHRANLGFILQTYVSLLKDPTFIGFCLIALLTYGGLFAWLTAGPVILIHGMHITPSQYGTLVIFTGLSTGFSGYIGGKLIKKMSLMSLLILGLALMIVAGAIILVSNALFAPTVLAVIIAAMFYAFGSTLVFLNCFSLGFKNVAKVAGYAGSLYSCIQLCGGFIFSGVLGFLNTSRPEPMAWMFVISGVASLILYFSYIHRHIK
jgi:DHA1 family bicyclomycin/chloramphenicol resistance-like MFS transporter/DHA1 family 2-module integral membrane pump EmrD-like MFS transporter